MDVVEDRTGGLEEIGLSFRVTCRLMSLWGTLRTASICAPGLPSSGFRREYAVALSR